jgi:hypothetical protein
MLCRYHLDSRAIRLSIICLMDLVTRRDPRDNGADNNTDVSLASILVSNPLSRVQFPPSLEAGPANKTTEKAKGTNTFHHVVNGCT